MAWVLGTKWVSAKVVRAIKCQAIFLAPILWADRTEFVGHRQEFSCMSNNIIVPTMNSKKLHPFWGLPTPSWHPATITTFPWRQKGNYWSLQDGSLGKGTCHTKSDMIEVQSLNPTWWKELTATSCPLTQCLCTHARAHTCVHAPKWIIF